MGKTKDLFNKIRATKGTFHTKIGTIRDRNSMVLTEAEDIKKRWQEYTEEKNSAVAKGLEKASFHSSSKEQKDKAS